MPRQRKDSSSEPKKRSRHGCWPCKTKKIKCGEEKPNCQNCDRLNERCDYSIRLNWEGIRKRKQGAEDSTLEEQQTSPGASEPIPITYIQPQNTATFRTPSSVASSRYGFGPLSGSGRKPGNVRSSSFASNSSLSLSRVTTHSPPDDLSPEPNVESSGSDPHLPSAISNQMRLDDSRAAATLTDLRFNRVDSNGTPNTFSTERRPILNGAQQSPSLSLPPLKIPASPLTPQYSAGSAEAYRASHPGQVPLQPAITPDAYFDLRRLSVKSFLHGGPSSQPSSTAHSPNHYVNYGIDRGIMDLDLPENDDAHAIIHVRPPGMVSRSSLHEQQRLKDDESAQNGFGFGRDTGNQATGGAYYARNVPVNIPWSMQPLPPLLTENPMNLLYFHHFINHTARVLVPHNCEANPFGNILPGMALTNDDLLNLMLAYSAYHRAGVLHQQPPHQRIARWTKNVFANLRVTLDGPKDNINDAHLATAIMLASLEIISPNSFEASVTWQTHLTAAKEMIISRGGWLKRDRMSYFLRVWFAYLDVVGSLSGNRYGRLLTYDELAINGPLDGEFDVDCLLGFTTRCIMILAKVADLCKQCDRERIRGSQILTTWRPSPEVVQAAYQLRDELRAARPTTFRECAYNKYADYHSAGVGALEMVAVNDSFHWAGLIHIYRRILGKQSHDEEVQIAVREILSALDKIRIGGSAENGMIFPIFTAGCEANVPNDRAKLFQRLMNVEANGLTQVHRARKLMQKVWSTHQPWESLVAGEFCG